MVNTFSPHWNSVISPFQEVEEGWRQVWSHPCWVRRTCLKTNKQTSNNKKDSVGNSSDNWIGGGGESIENALEWSWCSHRPKAKLQGGDGAGQVPEEAMVRTLWEDTGTISTHQRFFLSLRRILLLVFYVLFLFFVFFLSDLTIWKNTNGISVFWGFEMVSKHRSFKVRSKTTW